MGYKREKKVNELNGEATNLTVTDLTLASLEDLTTDKLVVINDDGDVGYEDKSNIASVSRTIDTSTTQTSALLNTSFPLESNPVGTMVTNLNTLQIFIYIRISNLLWRGLTLGSTI